MRNKILLILGLIVNLSFGQTETKANKIAIENFIRDYSNDDYNAIFSRLTDVMKKKFQKEQTIYFFKALKSLKGNITNHEFIKYEKEAYASYRITFEKTAFFLNILIDDNSKINGFVTKPFKKPQNIINNLTLKNGLITKEQSEIIFKNTKKSKNNTQVSIAIINNGNINYYGVKNKNGIISTIDNQQSIFEIGSISGIFTSTLLANFVIDKKVKLNENINDYLKIPFNNNTKISFIDLAHHTSGLSYYPSNIDAVNRDPENQHLEYFLVRNKKYREYKEKQLKLYITNYLELSTKGKYHYSDLETGLLGYTLRKIENDTYENLLQKKIFSKYNMQNSTTDINKIKENLVTSLNNEGKEMPYWEFSVLEGAGAIFSTVEDLSHFAIAQFDNSNKELNLTREKTFEVNEKTDVGLGWGVLKSKKENNWYFHITKRCGYSSFISIDLKTKNGIIILSNVSTFDPNKNMIHIDKLSYELMKSLKKE